MRILTVNAGSTSLKLVEVVDGSSERTLALEEALAGPPAEAVVHRIVHGGDRTAGARVDDRLVDELEELAALAPLHQPPALELLKLTRRSWPEVPHFACFDTAFHATIPVAARTYALPARFRSHVRAYGFHGLSHQWATGRLLRLAPRCRRIVVAHLGGGQSLCAVRDGRSVMTTMGFTPLDGLVMATRSGSIDPGALLWMQEHSKEDLAVVLAKESGLLGLSGTADMLQVQRRAEAGDDGAKLALDVWSHRAVTLLGACVAALEGLDALVFTGGIGENDRAARSRIASRLSWLGVKSLDDASSADIGDREVSADGASVRTFIIRSREHLQMAQEVEALAPSL